MIFDFLVATPYSPEETLFSIESRQKPQKHSHFVANLLLTPSDLRTRLRERFHPRFRS
jgi:hypothetical protein